MASAKLMIKHHMADAPADSIELRRDEQVQAPHPFLVADKHGETSRPESDRLTVRVARQRRGHDAPNQRQMADHEQVLLQPVQCFEECPRRIVGCESFCLPDNAVLRQHRLQQLRRLPRPGLSAVQHGANLDVAPREPLREPADVGPAGRGQRALAVNLLGHRVAVLDEIQFHDFESTMIGIVAKQCVEWRTFCNHSGFGGAGMVTMKNLLDSKGRDVWSIAPDAVVFDAIRLMADKGIGALPVVDAAKLVGIVSERDYARKIILQGRSSRDTPVRDIMTKRVYCVGPEESIDVAMALMTERRIRHLPILDAGRIIGIVSIGDLVKSLLAEKDFVIRQLESYIAG